MTFGRPWQLIIWVIHNEAVALDEAQEIKWAILVKWLVMGCPLQTRPDGLRWANELPGLHLEGGAREKGRLIRVDIINV